MPQSPCSEWPGTINAQGYGVKMVGGKQLRAHRMAYEAAKGPIPEGMVIDHLCRNRSCVNPEHLEVVTNRENLLRGHGWSGRNARKTACPQGHEYTGANTILVKGSRMCRVCHNERQRRNYHRRKETMTCHYI